MNRVYIQNCRTFSDAMNNLKFELSVPEYYETVVPEYFRKPMDIPKPIVNGVEVEWDEYLETHPDEKPQTFIPAPIYKGEDLNRAFAKKSCAEIIDLVINDVPFEFIDYNDIETVVGIFDGYYDEVRTYIPLNTHLKLFITNMESARIKLMNVYNAVTLYKENTSLKPKKQLTLIDILNRMK